MEVRHFEPTGVRPRTIRTIAAVHDALPCATALVGLCVYIIMQRIIGWVGLDPCAAVLNIRPIGLRVATGVPGLQVGAVAADLTGKEWMPRQIVRLELAAVLARLDAVPVQSLRVAASPQTRIVQFVDGGVIVAATAGFAAITAAQVVLRAGIVTYGEGTEGIARPPTADVVWIAWFPVRK